MSSLETNKLAAAVLVGGMITLSIGLLSNFLYKPGHEGKEQTVAGEGATAAARPAPVEPISGLLASADPAKGAEIAKKCASCHSFGKGEAAKVGPNLWGIVGNKHGHAEGFAYSAAIKSISAPWGYEELNHFLASPKSYAPGTKMTFPGLPKAEDRAAVIAWLRTQADSQMPLPSDADIKAANETFKKEQTEMAKPASAASAAPQTTATPAPAAAAAPAAAPAASTAVPMIASADPVKGAEISKRCMTCHSFDKDGPNRVGPNLWGVVEGPTAHKADFPYSAAIKGLNKTWTYAELDRFLSDPKAYAPGTKMSFAGLKKAEERAALLAWLRTMSDNPAPLPK